MTLPFIGLYPAYLLLKKQGFMCPACRRSFTAETSVVNKHCYISKNVKTFIVIKAAEAQSLTSIGKDCSVSPTTVQREINEVASSLQKYHSK